MITNVGILRANPSRLFDNTENLFFEEEEEKKGEKEGNKIIRIAHVSKNRRASQKNFLKKEIRKSRWVDES